MTEMEFVLEKIEEVANPGPTGAQGRQDDYDAVDKGIREVEKILERVK